MYVTAVQLADRPGATELAQVATPERKPVVDADLMDATLRAGDRSAWSSDDQAVADLALAVVQDAITSADALIDGYLARRYTLPLTSSPPILAVWGRAIARYQLHKDRRTMETNDPVVRDYNDALKLLAQVAAGTFSLGADDAALEDDGDSDVVFVAGDVPVFGSDQMGSFR